MKENDLINEGVVSEFGTRLRLFHYLTDQPLTKKAFEFQLCRTLNSNQIKCAVTENSTLPGADLVLEGSNQKISLKTEGSKSLSRKKIYISKLMEARWFRDCKTDQDLQVAIQKWVIPHLSHYDRILILRSSPSNCGNYVSYQLVEIPIDLIKKCGRKSALSFLKRSKGGSATVTVMDEKNPKFQLTFDKSAEKVILKNLYITDCILLANWTISI